MSELQLVIALVSAIFLISICVANAIVALQDFYECFREMLKAWKKEK